MRFIFVGSLLATLAQGVTAKTDKITTHDSPSMSLSCAGTSTYGFTPRETVTVTVDGEYTYYGNGSATDIYYTPPPPCSEVVVPGFTTPESTTSISTEISASAECTTSLVPATNTTVSRGPPYANVSMSSITTCTTVTYVRSSVSGIWGSWTTIPAPSAPSVSSAVHSTAATGTSSVEGTRPELTTESEPNESLPPTAFASEVQSAVTVTVTKKTPVPASNGGPTLVAPTFPGNNDVSVNSGSPTAIADQSNSPLPGNSVTGVAPAPGVPTPNPGNNENSNSNSNESPTGGGIGSIINSAFNSPFTQVGVATSFGAASATVTLVNGVPVQVGSSSVFIGGSNVALPTGSSTAFVTINGETFTVGPSAIVGGSTTLSLNRPESISYSAVQAATLKASTITQDGVVVTVDATDAVVSGTTFSIGLNAKETTYIVSGHTIVFNSNGVVFPTSTTYKPAIITAAAYVVTTIGQLTFSIDQSEAIVSGTTYRIGAGSLNSKTTAVIDGTTVVFGPSGIVLPSTTIAPTGVSLTTSGSSRTSTGGSKVVSQPGATSSGGAIGTTSRPPSYLPNPLCVAVMILAAATLPLSLIL